jgi:hypothetical protein
MTMLKKIENKNDNPTLSDAQKFVGGYVELVRLKDGILIVNEEGKIKQLEYNEPASKLYAESYGDLDIIFGPAIYIPNNVPSEWHG